MSFRGQPTALSTLLGSLIKDMGLKPRIDAARVVEAWAVVAGPQICAVTERARFENGALSVEMRSSVWRHSLHMQRGAWCSRLNEELGDELVREIQFR